LILGERVSIPLSGQQTLKQQMQPLPRHQSISAAGAPALGLNLMAGMNLSWNHLFRLDDRGMIPLASAQNRAS
jgi:hypothetical protein